MSELVKYDAACRALAEAVAVDEVADIRNKAEALRHYARQAGDRGLEIQAAQIRFRAERKMGDLLVAAKAAGQVREGRPKNRSDAEQFSDIDGGALADAEAAFDDYRAASPFRVTLEEAGIDRKLSMRAQRMAAMDAAEFEAALARHAGEMRAGQGRVAMDLLKVGAEDKGRAHRRDLAAALSEQTAMLPAGRVYPCAYIDLPWKREGGIGDRAYENHYPTMSWPEILTFLRGARESLLPDSWAFFWIPRAHLLALVGVELEVTVAETGEVVIAKVDMPLGWAVGHALGMDSYSTCFVWTKTDQDHPDVSGSGLIAWDQDELLLLFKRGRGLPKPSGAEKFGSNHRERPREHSRKPDFYRQMIATMTGGLPVLEMFARVDAEHPLPPGWDACGNQAGAVAVEIAADPAPVADPVLAAVIGAGIFRQPPQHDRKVYPAGHVVSMTNPVIDGAMRSIGRCACGEVFSVAWGDQAEMEAAIEAHWQLFDAQPERIDGRGNAIAAAKRDLAGRLTAEADRLLSEIENSISPLGLPSDGGTVAAAADATSARASPAAAVTDNSAPAFPPSEFADLKSFECRDEARIPAAQVEAIAPEYVRRGLVHSWCGSWRLSPAGVIRLQVIERERAERSARCRAVLEQQDFWDWRDLDAVAAGEDLDGGSVRSLVGLDLAQVNETRVMLTGAGRARLAELEAIVDGAAPAPLTVAPAPSPVQLDLVQILEGAK